MSPSRRPSRPSRARAGNRFRHEGRSRERPSWCWSGRQEPLGPGPERGLAPVVRRARPGLEVGGQRSRSNPGSGMRSAYSSPCSRPPSSRRPRPPMPAPVQSRTRRRSSAPFSDFQRGRRRDRPAARAITGSRSSRAAVGRPPRHRGDAPGPACSRSDRSARTTSSSRASSCGRSSGNAGGAREALRARSSSAAIRSRPRALNSRSGCASNHSRGVVVRSSQFSHCGDHTPKWSTCLLPRWAAHTRIMTNWFHDCRGCDFIGGQCRPGSRRSSENRFDRALACKTGWVKCSPSGSDRALQCRRHARHPKHLRREPGGRRAAQPGGGRRQRPRRRQPLPARRPSHSGHRLARGDPGRDAGGRADPAQRHDREQHDPLGGAQREGTPSHRSCSAPTTRRCSRATAR